MRSPAVAVSLLFFSVILVYWPVAGFPFLNWDDDRFLLENQNLNPATLESVSRLWTDLYSPNYSPLFFTVWAAIASFSRYIISASAVAGLEPSVFHTANLVVHLLNTLLVFNILALLLRYGFRGSYNDRDSSQITLPAVMGAVLFALHPVQVEAVAWVTGFHTVLAGFFVFLTIREYLIYAFGASGVIELSDRAITFHYLKAFSTFIFAILVKPIVVVVPLLLFVLDRWAVGRPANKSAKSLALWIAVSFLFVLFTLFVQPKEWMVVATPLWSRPFIAGDILAFYLYKIFVPLSLAIDYGRSTDFLLNGWSVYVSWVVPFALLFFAGRMKNRILIVLPFSIFVIGILPVIGIVPYYLHATSTVADRYLYIPMLGASLAVSFFFLKLKSKRIRQICLLIPIPLGILAAFQVLTWQSNTALFEKAVSVNHKSVIGQTNLALSFIRLGELEKAEKHLRISLELKPDAPKTYNNLGIVFMKEGKPDEAIAHFQKAIILAPRFALAHNNLGMVLVKAGKLDDATASFRKAIEIKPNFARPHSQLGLILIKRGNLDDGVEHLRRAVALLPLSATAHNDIGKALLEMGRINEAIEHLQKAQGIRPESEEIRANLEKARADGVRGRGISQGSHVP